MRCRQPAVGTGPGVGHRGDAIRSAAAAAAVLLASRRTRNQRPRWTPADRSFGPDRNNIGDTPAPFVTSRTPRAVENLSLTLHYN